MKMRALDSFASAETGMVHAGDEFEITSAVRAKEFEDRGLAKPIGEKAEPAPDNKMEEPPANKADPLDHDGDGRKGGAKPAPGRKPAKRKG
jgi:hypothetical protein